MLYWLLFPFASRIPALNVFRYITFRTGGAIMTALLFVFLFGPAIIDVLRIKQGKISLRRIDRRLCLIQRSFCLVKCLGGDINLRRIFTRLQSSQCIEGNFVTFLCY